MFDELWKIDKRMGESRRDQILGIVLLICIILFSIWWTFFKT
jgi:hypothetical protein